MNVDNPIPKDNSGLVCTHTVGQPRKLNKASKYHDPWRLHQDFPSSLSFSMAMLARNREKLEVPIYHIYFGPTSPMKSKPLQYSSYPVRRGAHAVTGCPPMIFAPRRPWGVWLEAYFGRFLKLPWLDAVWKGSENHGRISEGFDWWMFCLPSTCWAIYTPVYSTAP